MSNYKSYFLKSLGLREDTVLGSDGTVKSKESDQMKLGIKTETAHTGDEQLAKQIATKHLNEDPTYYSTLKEAGMPEDDEKSEPPSFAKLAPKVRCPQVIGMAVRGTKTGLLPAGGIVDDPERARLGGFELIQNKKPNSQGAIANTPASEDIKSDGGHYTPDNKEISKGKGPKTSKKGEETTHPFQTQQLGNKPFEDDGTTRDGEHTPEAAGGDGDKNGGDGRCNDAKPSASTASDKQDYKAEKSDAPEKKEKKKGPWGIDIDEPEKDEDSSDDGEDVEIDIKEKDEKKDESKEEPKEEKKDEDKEENKNLQERFQKLANIPIQETLSPSKTVILERIVEAMVGKRRTFDTPESVATSIVNEIVKRGIKGYNKQQDFILKKVTQCWK
jgi:hypothetical protein